MPKIKDEIELSIRSLGPMPQNPPKKVAKNKRAGLLCNFKDTCYICIVNARKEPYFRIVSPFQHKTGKKKWTNSLQLCSSRRLLFWRTFHIYKGSFRGRLYKPYIQGVRVHWYRGGGSLLLIESTVGPPPPSLAWRTGMEGRGKDHCMCGKSS